MLQKKTNKGFIKILALLLVSNSILLPSKSYACNEINSYEEDTNENHQKVEAFFDSYGYLTVRINNTTEINESNFIFLNSNNKYFSNPTWKSWKNIATIKNSTAAKAIDASIAGGLLKFLPVVFNFIPKGVLSKMITATGIVSSSPGASMVKIWDKNHNGKLEWQKRVKSDIYGNIAQTEWRVK